MVSRQFPCSHDKINRNVNLTLKEVNLPGELSIARTIFECDSRQLYGNNKTVFELKLEDLCPACMYERMHAGWL